jgi:succinate dehydrogenase / fumarate reductase, flavoprotein subunit
VHGANRLGTNSLVDIIVFGRRGGRHMGQYAATATWVDVPQHADQPAVDEIQRLLSVSGSESMADIRAELQEGMTKYASVLREAHGLQVMLASIRALQQRFRQAPVQDKGTSFNNELEEAMELGYLLDLAWVTTHAALARNESRGAHYREDFQERDDAKFLVHSLAYLKDDAIDLTYKPVTITKYQPKPRVY